MNNLCLKAGFNGPDIILQFFLREISMTDYYRKEATQSSVGYAANKMLKTQGVDIEDDETNNDQ